MSESFSAENSALLLIDHQVGNNYLLASITLENIGLNDYGLTIRSTY